MELAQLNDIIKSSKNILITSHINPDGDTLGAMCGIYSLIETNFKKKCDMLLVSKLPKLYEFLPNIKRAKYLEKYDKSREYDLVINVDVAALDRICDAQILFKKSKVTVNIDHHKTNIAYADLNFIEPEASSASEVVYGIAKDLNWKIDINSAICLYTGILTDTGSFRFNNTTSRALRFASELVEIGVSPEELYKLCYENRSKNMVLFQSYCVDKATFLDDDKIAYTTVYKKDLEKFNAEDDFTEGLTEKLRAIVSTKIAFVAKEMSNGWTRISMRSKSIDIAEVCEVFGGGGHKLASGCTIKCGIKDAVNKVLDEIRKRKL